LPKKFKERTKILKIEMDRMKDMNNVAFVIAHKYFRGFDSYVEYYVKNIKKLYENSTIIVVDNNSVDRDDIFDELRKIDGVVLLDNDIESKFEIGAYTVGLKYLIDNKIDFEYVVFTQDVFVLKNRFDFACLYADGILACPLVGCSIDHSKPEYKGIHNDCSEVWHPVLSNLGLLSDMENQSFCWCTSFVTHKEKIAQLYSYINTIVVKTRWEGAGSERYMARILFELNNGKNHSIDGDIRELKYDSHSVDIYSDVDSFFVKRNQQKHQI
jgi:hypothetical protein